MFQTTEYKVGTTYDLVSIFSHHFLGDNFAKKKTQISDFAHKYIKTYF